jgi:SAM-dependent methyltransferase
MTHETRWYARAFDSAYLEVYAHRDAREAERATQYLLEPLVLGQRRVLDLACGAGRHACALARRGARVVGLDLSAELLARARLAAEPDAPGPDFVRGDMLHLPFAAAAFDLVVSMFTSFGYFATEHDDRRVLEEIRRVLHLDGVLILDVFNAERVRRDLVPKTRRRAGRFDVHERRRLDVPNGTVIKEIEIVDGQTTHHYEEVVRLWTRPMLEDALRDHSFAIEHAWGDYDASPFDPGRSPRLVLQARARAVA